MRFKFKYPFVPKSMTQKEKVLYVLRDYGETGIHSFDLIAIISHKAPARLSELRITLHLPFIDKEKASDVISGALIV